MSEFEPDVEITEAQEPPAPRSAGRVVKRVLIGIGVAIAVLAVLGAVLYKFGSMWPPSAEAKATYAQLEQQGSVPPVDKQFHIPIPGCVCHSDNPVLQVQHSNRRISQCMECHGG